MGKRTITSEELGRRMAERAEAESLLTEALACAAGEVRNVMVDGFQIPKALQGLTREEIRRRNYGRRTAAAAPR